MSISQPDLNGKLRADAICPTGGMLYSVPRTARGFLGLMAMSREKL
jgi:hypothetical protein